MKSRKKLTALIASGAIVAAGLCAPLPAFAGTQAGDAEGAVAPGPAALLDVSDLNADGFRATVSNGTFTANDDGSVTVKDSLGRPAAFFNDHADVEGVGSVGIDYSVEGDELVAHYDEALPAELATPGFAIATRGTADCIVGGMLAVGATAAAVAGVLTAPATLGGSLVVTGASMGALGADVNMVQQCSR